VGEVELEDDSSVDLLRMGGSRICVRFHNSLTLGWDFGITGSSPIPLSSTSSERPYLYFTGGDYLALNGPALIVDSVTRKAVFQFSGRYANPRKVQWDGRYLVTGYDSAEVLILDFNQMLS
jgi:hypothetical protein